MNDLKRMFLMMGLVVFAVVCAFGQETEIQYLSGTGSDDGVDWEFFCTAGMNSGHWTTIAVPSCWEQQGFGAYNYGYDRAAGRAQEQGLYRHRFSVPASWQGKVVNLVFEGSMTDTEVKVNGELAGPVHQGGFYRFKYDISQKLHYGRDNLLEVTVSKVSVNRSVNRAERHADYWIFGGIFRPVYLEALPETHIRRAAIDARADGHLSVQVDVSSTGRNESITAQLIDPDGTTLPLQLNAKINKSERVTLTGDLDSVQTWTPESPYLYTLILSLERNGKLVHRIQHKIGFRTLEIKERDGVYLNGIKIKFKGVNRHSFYPSTGRTLSNAQIRADVELVRAMNMNAVRNSHYPADAYFYQVCDELGVMVLDELGGWHDAYDTEAGTPLVAEMIDKSMNHPCVVMWINGNEGGHNEELLPLYRSLDIQQRPVLQAWENFSGIDTQHYRDYNYGVGSHYQGHDIVMGTEFLHGLYDGGHGAGLEDFWNLMWNLPLSAGGFLWNFADEAVVRTDRDGILDSDGNHGADGILGPYHEKEGSYYTIKEVWSPVFFEHREITPAFDGTFRLENRYYFTNLNQCDFTWTLQHCSNPSGMIAAPPLTGQAESPDIAPLAKGTLQLELPETWLQFDVLAVTAAGPDGREIFTWTWPIHRPSDIQQRLVTETGDDKPSITETDTALIAQAGEVKLYLDRRSGVLLGVENAQGTIPLANGPVLCEGDSEFVEWTHHMDQENLIVEAQYTRESVFKTQQWTLFPSGWVHLQVVYSPKVERHELLGISFDYPEDRVTGIRWMGDGPYRVWKNRMKGNQFGVWDKAYNDTITGQTEYIYPEFKGYHANMVWLTVQSQGQDFTVVTPDEDLFFRMYTPGTPKDPYNTAPAFPSGDISFMQGITPIGTKCLQTFRMGPMSVENIYYTYGGKRPLDMTLYFDFTGK